MDIRVRFQKLAASIAAIFTELFIFVIFLGARKKGESATITIVKGTGYMATDYALAAITPVIVFVCKWAETSYFTMSVIVWIQAIGIAYALILFSRHIVNDFTLTEALRSSVEVNWNENKRIVAVLKVVMIIVRFSIWDGPERTVIFLQKEIDRLGRIGEIMAVIIFSSLQAIVWTKIYSAGYDGVGNLIRALW